LARANASKIAGSGWYTCGVETDTFARINAPARSVLSVGGW
jgi:hypothetical protein